jgi:hypothetical protein
LLADICSARMIKALLLIFDPIRTWERVVVARRPWTQILWLYFLPFLVLVSCVEGYGIRRWGKPRGDLDRLQALPLAQILFYEAAEFVLALLTVLFVAKLIKSMGETFHGRHTFAQAFTVAAYGLSPVLLLRMLDAFPSVSPWLTWGLGVVLAAVILYHGLPRVMQPDPPHAFGLYLMSTVLLFIVTGLARFVTAWYLEGRFTKLDDVISRVTSGWKF